MGPSIRRLWLGVTLIVAASAFLLLSDSESTTSTVPRIAVLQYSSMVTLDDGARGLLDQLKASGYENGKRAVIDRFNAENDSATANSMATEIASGKYDYAFTISTNCLQAMANANRAGKVKHVFGVVADPVAAKVGVSATNPLDHPRHMAGIGTLLPVGRLMEMARRFNPRVQRFGVPWNPSQANSQKFLEMARETAGRMHVDLLEGPVDSSAAVGEVTSSLVARGADAILVVGDVTVGLAIDAVISAARKGKIPVISVLPDAVPRGAAVGVGADFYTVGRQMGELCARILGGADMAKIPIVNAVPMQYAFNLKALEGLKDNWRIPQDQVAKADVIVDGTGVHKKPPSGF